MVQKYKNIFYYVLKKKKAKYLPHMNKLNGVCSNTNIFSSIVFASPINKNKLTFLVEQTTKTTGVH